jgi:ribulose-5-phosphate 4-epimerase/fuculose-1-phosphate aldolase
VHQHPRFTTIWSALGRIPPVYDQRSAAVPDEDLVFYDDYQGGVTELGAARDAVAGINKGTCAILRNHGAFVVADSIAQAFTRSTTLEWRCKQAWYVEAIGGGKAMPPPGREWLAELFVASGGIAPTQWPWAVRRELRADPSLLNCPTGWGSRALGPPVEVAVAANTNHGGRD